MISHTTLEGPLPNNTWLIHLAALYLVHLKARIKMQFGELFNAALQPVSAETLTELHSN